MLFFRIILNSNTELILCNFILNSHKSYTLAVQYDFQILNLETALKSVNIPCVHCMIITGILVLWYRHRTSYNSEGDLFILYCTVWGSLKLADALLYTIYVCNKLYNYLWAIATFFFGLNCEVNLSKSTIIVNHSVACTLADYFILVSYDTHKVIIMYVHPSLFMQSIY